jgi:hypothetical protein
VLGYVIGDIAQQLLVGTNHSVRSLIDRATLHRGALGSAPELCKPGPETESRSLSDLLWQGSGECRERFRQSAPPTSLSTALNVVGNAAGRVVFKPAGHLAP